MGYYVPNLGTTLISVRQHIQYKGCYFHAENNECVLAFPSFISTTVIGDEITLPISPSKNSPDPIDFDEQTAELCKPSKSIFTVVNPAISKMAIIKTKDTTQVFIKQLLPNAYIPRQSTPGAAGFDVKIVTV